MDRDKLSNLYRGPPIDDTYQVSAYLAKQFQRGRFFRNQPIRSKNCLWRPCLLTDRERNQQSLQRTFQRCFLPSYGSFGLTVLEEKILKNQPIQKQELSMATMFVNGLGRNEQTLQMLPTKFQFIWQRGFRGED